MCLILFAYNCHPRYQLVVAANRDEFYRRPTQSAGFWPESPGLLAGRDLEQGGTWLGVTTGGLFAALTNYRDGKHNPKAPSRGHLVQEYLQGTQSPDQFIRNLSAGGTGYNGFSLLLGSFNSLYYYSNRENVLEQVTPGVHGLSNSLLDKPWPKVDKGKQALTDCLQERELTKEALFELMADQERPADQELPQTGLSLEWERILAPIYVVSADYGTRSTSVVLVDRQGLVRFWERSFSGNFVDRQPGDGQEVFYQFKTNQD